MPRFVFWTIVLGAEPTAFRTKERDELLPTLKQLQRHHPDAAIKWFARGQLWDSQEAEREARDRERGDERTRSRGWRPGGEHRDPRDEYKKKPRDEKRRELAHKLGWKKRDESSGGPEGAPPPTGSDRPQGDDAPPGDRRRADVRTAIAATDHRARKLNVNPGATGRPTRRRPQTVERPATPPAGRPRRRTTAPAG